MKVSFSSLRYFSIAFKLSRDTNTDIIYIHVYIINIIIIIFTELLTIDSVDMWLGLMITVAHNVR